MVETPAHLLGVVLPSLLLAAFPFAVAGLCALIMARGTVKKNFAPAFLLAFGIYGTALFMWAWAGQIGGAFWWMAPAAVTVAVALASSWLSGRSAAGGRNDGEGDAGAIAAGEGKGAIADLVPGVLTFALAAGSLAVLCFDPVVHSDALWYHLTLPAEWVRGGGLTANEMEVAGYPLLAEMLFSIPVTFGLPSGAKLLHLGAAMAVAGIIYSYLRPRMAAGPALAIAAFYLLLEPSREVATWANTDHFRALFTVGALACASRASEARSRKGRESDLRMLLMAGGLAGFAMSTSYIPFVFATGLVAAAMVAGRVVGMLRGERGGGDAKDSFALMFRDVVAFGVTGLVVVSPWLVKNVVYYGEPFYGLPRGVGWTTPDLFVYARDNAFLLATAVFGLAFMFRRATAASDRIVAFYLMGFLALGAIALPDIARFFLPAMAAALMLMGSAVGPLLTGANLGGSGGARPKVALILSWLIFGYAAGMFALQARSGFYADAMVFVFEGRPPMEEVIWHK